LTRALSLTTFSSRPASFDVVDFGDCGWDDGAGDESLDAFVTPEWERSNRLEPRQYQDDHEDTAAMALDTFSSPTAGGSSVRRQRITSDDLSSPDPDYPWTTHPTALPPPPPPLAAAGLSAAGATTASSSSHPPITPQRYSAPTAAPHGPLGGGVHHHLAAHEGQTFSPSGYSAPPPAATTNASPSFDRKSSSLGAGGSAPRSWEADQSAAAERDAGSGPISRRMLAGTDAGRTSRTVGSDTWQARASAEAGRKALRRSRTAEWRPLTKETDDALPSDRDGGPSREAAMRDAGADDLAGEDQPMKDDA